MIIKTKHFGEIDIDTQSVITFSNGLIGFPNHTRFVLIQQEENSYFFWLQSIEEPNIAFVVTDPSLFFENYDSEEIWQKIDRKLSRLLVICSKVNQSPVANLRAPLIINIVTRYAMQQVLSDSQWTTQHLLI